MLYASYLADALKTKKKYCGNKHACYPKHV